MANPNVLIATSLVGKTVYSNVTTTLSNVVQNSTASNKSLRIVNISLAGIDTVISPNVTIGVVRANVLNYIVSNITIPIKSVVIITGKENNIFLEEGDDLRMISSANNTVWATVSYEEIM
jgi:hypothetical protein